MNKGLIYICDSQSEAQEQIARILSGGGYAAEIFASGTQLLKALADSHGAPPDMVLLDSSLEEDSLEVLCQIKARSKELPVLIVSAYASVRSAVNFLKQGASDYLVKPILSEELLQQLGLWVDRRRLVAENRSLRAEVQRRFDPSQVVYRSEGFSKVLALANRVAASEASVLILGESGVGKELVASTIHYSSERSERRFLTINCAALTDTLLESQLFGHVKGAFTGATSTHRGLVEEASHGTLFLDEIGDISPALQAKLLRLLQEKEFLPVGSTRVQHADVRFVAATNRDLEAAVANGSFREDLYYRLNVITLNVPPLRERLDDVKPLAEFFVSRYASVAGQEISQDVIDLLQTYSWPGNVRELENAMEHAFVLADGPILEMKHLPSELRHADKNGTPPPPPKISPKISPKPPAPPRRCRNPWPWRPSGVDLLRCSPCQALFRGDLGRAP